MGAGSGEGEEGELPSGGAADDGGAGAAGTAGGEISLSVEETNKLRARLGLKPLREDGGEDREAAERQRHADRVGQAKKDAEGRALREKLAEFRQRRQMEQELQQTKWLGVKENEEEDDLAKWVEKSREAERARRADEQDQMQRLQKMLDDSDQDDSEKDEPAYTGADLAGLKVRHGADEFGAGEGVVLTLADRGILDDRGELNEDQDELEVGLLAEQRRRAAERAKAKGQDRDQGMRDLEKGVILSKYDDEDRDADVALKIGSDGAIAAEEAMTVEEMRMKKERGKFAVGKKAENLETSAKVMEDQYTKEELGAMMQKSKKHRRKRKKEKRLTDTDLDALEKTAPQKAPSSRACVEAPSSAGAAQTASRPPAPSIQEIKESRKRAYKRALDEAANEDRFFKQRETSAMETEQGEAVPRAGEGVAAPQGKAFVLQQVQAQRGKVSALDQSNHQMYAGEAFTETTEFVNTMKHNTEQKRREEQHEAVGPGPGPGSGQPGSTAVEAPGPGSAGAGSSGAGPSGAAPVPESAPVRAPTPRFGATDSEAAGMPGKLSSSGAEGEAGPSERNIQKGLGAALEMLKSRNELGKGKIEWAGRTNDKKSGKVRDVLESFQDKNRFAQDVEFALTRRDEFGRVMTPKEAFRQLCHQFHGIAPGKNKQEKKIRQYKEELKQKKASQGDTPLQMMGSLKAAQKSNSTPYMVLSGTVKPGQSSVAQGTFSVGPEAPAAASPAPALGGWAAAGATASAAPKPPPAARSRVQMALGGGAPKRQPVAAPGATPGAAPAKRPRTD